jgi:hypothetical protein
VAYRKPRTAQPQVEDDEPRQLSQNGHMVGIGVYGFLVLVGFMFGIVTGYERPRAVTVARAPKETPKVETPAQPKPAPNAGTTPPVVEPNEEPPRKEPPKIDMPTPIVPKKTEPKKSEPKKKDKTVAVQPVSFQKDVLPIFRAYCLNCHGDVGAPKGDVDLRTVASIKRGGGGPILEVGNPDRSAIYTSIVDGAMPPNNKKPSRGEMDVIRDWILTGANPRRAIRTRRHGRR